MLQGLQRVSGGLKMVSGDTRGYNGLPRVTRGYSGLPEVTRGYRELRGDRRD